MPPPRPIPVRRSTELEALMPDLRRVARYLTRDRDQADDIVQDILLKLWVRLADPDQDDISDLRHYAFAALRNRIRDRGPEPDRIGLDGLPPPTSPPDAPARLACADTLSALEDLPEDQATLLRLQAIDGLSQAEIARRTGLPPGTIASRLSRARAALRHRLDLPPGAPVTFLID